MKKNILLMIIASSLSAYNINLSSGWNFISFSNLNGDSISKTELVTILSSSLTIQGFSNSGGTLSTYINPKKLYPNLGYWVYSSSGGSGNIPEGVAKETLFDKGWNLIGLSNQEDKTSFKNRFALGGVTVGTIQTFVNNTGVLSTQVNPSTLNANQAYWMYVSAIDYDEYIDSIVPNDTTLVDVSDSSVRGKSIVTARKNGDTDSLEFRLTSFDNATNTYKKVTLNSGFAVSSLNGDVNATASSNIPSTGECGNWATISSTTFNLNKTEDNTTFTTNSAVYGSEGNLTIGGTYEKVVWYGSYIPIESIECSISVLPTFDDCVDGNENIFPQPPTKCTNLQ
jgi:hypothetical protein